MATNHGASPAIKREGDSGRSLAIGFAVPIFGQQEDTVDPKIAEAMLFLGVKRAAGFWRAAPNSSLTIGDREHVSMTRSAGSAPANQVLAFQLPANIINRERKRSGDQISPIKSHSFFCGMMASSDFVRISPFRRSANVDGVDWLPPTSRPSSLNS
jgi:hypothetical protein